MAHITTTPRTILNFAYGYSSKNQPGTLGVESTELLQLVIRSMRGLYALAARVNPTFFAKTEPVTFDAVLVGWPRPPKAESIFYIEDPTLAEVVVVPFDDRLAEPSLPAVYRIGQIYKTAGNSNDPVSGDLTFWYSKRPDVPANIDAVLDESWTEQFNELLILEVAIYLAIKDIGSEGRPQEIASLQAKRDYWLQLFIAFLEHETAIERKRYGNIRKFNLPSLVPLGNMVAGGSNII